MDTSQEVQRGLLITWYEQAIEEAKASRNDKELSALHTRHALEYSILLHIPHDVTLGRINGGDKM